MNTVSSPWNIIRATKVDSSQSVSTKTVLDSLGRVSQTQVTSDPAGTDYVDTTYDALGRVHTVSNSYRSTSDPTYGLTTYTYDAMGRVTQIAYPNGSNKQFTYTNRAVHVAGNYYGLSQVYQVDGLGRMVSVCDGINAPQQSNDDTTNDCNQDIDYNGFKATYGYDALGNLISVTYGGATVSQTRSFVFDYLSRMTSETNPENGTTNYYYDTSTPGELYQIKDARGVTSTYSYDAMHRVTGITFSDSTPSVSYSYDQSSVWGNPIQNGKGRLTYGTIGTGTASTGISYDEMGRVLDTYSCTPFSCSHSTDHIGYTYDFLGERTSLIDHNMNTTLTYSYDSIGKLTAITSSLSNSTNPATIISGFQYNALGLPTSNTRADGNTETYSYTRMGQLSSYSATGPVPYSITNIQRNTAGDITALTDSINGTWSFAYYGVMLHKLSWANCTANCPAAAGTPFAYGYDEFGNRWGTLTGTNQYSFDVHNHITNSGVTYDAAGDMTADGLGNSYTYDALHRLTSISGPNPETYLYDAFGNRVEENPSTGTIGYATDFIFDLDGHILHRATGNNSAFGMEVYAQGRHLGLYVGNFYETYQNQVNTVRMRVAYNSGGSSLYGTCTELPFGDARACTTHAGVDQDFFAGYRNNWDNSYSAPARTYSAVQGRWYTPDPAGLAAVDRTNPQTWNQYAYVTNNPLNSTDPLGLWQSDVFGTATLGGGDPFRDPGGAQWAAVLQAYYDQAGFGSPLQQGKRVYQAQVDCAFNPGSCPKGVPGTPGGPVLVPGGAIYGSYANQYSSVGPFLLGMVDAFSVPSDVWAGYAANAYQQLQQWWTANSYYRVGLSEEDAKANELSYRISVDTSTIFTPCDGLQVGSTLLGVQATPWIGETLGRAAYFIGNAGAIASLGCD